MVILKHPITLFFVLTALPLMFTAAVAAEDQRARRIMQQVDQRDDGDNRSAEMQMHLIDKNNNQRVRSIKSFSKDFNKDTYNALFFLAPVDVKNTAFLTYDYKNGNKDDDQWLYLPAIRKSKRIASTDKSGSFMGSDFNYSDMTSMDINDYDYTVEKEIEVRSHPAWVIQALPRSQKVINETGYKKSLLIVRKDNFFIVRAVHWNEKGNALKYYDVTGLEKINNIWSATEVSMTTKQNNKTLHRTIIKFRDIKYNQPLDKDMFTVRRIEKGL